MKGPAWAEVMALILIFPEAAVCSAACVNGPQSVPYKIKSASTSPAPVGCCRWAIV